MDIRAQVKEQLEFLMQQGDAKSPVRSKYNGPMAICRWTSSISNRSVARCGSLKCVPARPPRPRPTNYKPPVKSSPGRFVICWNLYSFTKLTSSRPPFNCVRRRRQREERTVRYYEVTAQRDGGWRLVRYEKQPGQPRQQVAAFVTAEALQRLCHDVVDIATR